MTFVPGDFILVRGDAWYSKCISFGERLRYGRDPNREQQFTHCAGIVSTDGDLVEALGGGVCRTNIRKYSPGTYRAFSIDRALSAHPIVAAAQRRNVVTFGLAQVGRRYDYLDILSVSLGLLTGGKLSITTDDKFICSELWARALERTDMIFDRQPSNVMPADLAKIFG